MTDHSLDRPSDIGHSTDIDTDAINRDVIDRDVIDTDDIDTDNVDRDYVDADVDGSDAGTSDGSGDLMIDCSTCLARPAACGDCIVSVLLGPIEHVGREEQVAFAVLADSGLVPPLRLVRGDQGVA